MASELSNHLTNKFGAFVELVKSSGGVFDVEKNGELIFSKKKSGRFPDDGEIDKLLD